MVRYTAPRVWYAFDPMGSQNPHDALVHAIFSRAENAVGQLRAVLPPELVQRLDWTTLRVESGHQTDPELADTYSDLLYSVQLDEHEVLLYVLFEHQSSEDFMMPLRLLRYMLRTWDWWLGEHPKAKHIPAIIPVVLSHAEGGWRKPTSLGELYGLGLRGLIDLATSAVLGAERSEERGR